MAVQKTIRQFQTTGIVGDIVLSGPVRAQAGVLNTSTATYNVIGSAMTHVSGKNGQFTVGGTGVFAGILANSKQYGLYGTSAGTLEPSTTIPNNTVVEGVTFTSGILVSLTNQAAIGNQIEFSQTNGTLQANTTGTASAGYTLIPNSRVVRFNTDGAGLAVVELTE